MAALLGALPIALGVGAGAESHRPLGLAFICTTSAASIMRKMRRCKEALGTRR